MPVVAELATLSVLSSLSHLHGHASGCRCRVLDVPDPAGSLLRHPDVHRGVVLLSHVVPYGADVLAAVLPRLRVRHIDHGVDVPAAGRVAPGLVTKLRGNGAQAALPPGDLGHVSDVQGDVAVEEEGVSALHVAAVREGDPLAVACHQGQLWQQRHRQIATDYCMGAEDNKKEKKINSYTYSMYIGTFPEALGETLTP